MYASIGCRLMQKGLDSGAGHSGEEAEGQILFHYEERGGSAAGGNDNWDDATCGWAGAARGGARITAMLAWIRAVSFTH